MTEPTLSPTEIIDSDHPSVAEFAARHATGTTDLERAVALYYAVRDGFRYDPYRIDLTPAGMKASAVIAKGYGWCVTKAALLAAACRAARIPSRVGYADVRNHLSTERMRAVMGTDVFYWHGFTEIHLDGAWVKATPAFNVELCDRFGLRPLEFDGRADSIYHPFDRHGHRHMEYLAQRGSYDEVPLERMVGDFMRLYPAWRSYLETMQRTDFIDEIDREARP
jgi:transglutaminase-like putative cysteine protease